MKPDTTPSPAKRLSRRSFLQLGALAAGCLAAVPLNGKGPDGEALPVGQGRVGTSYINLYAEPSFRSKRLGKIQRDTLLPIMEEVIPSSGPRYNPRWYRLAEGYVHSGYIQRVDRPSFNQPLESSPEQRILGEITVAYTQSMRINKYSGLWYPLYRLYYQSVHWINRLDTGPDGLPWYWLKDERLMVEYAIPARHIRPLSQAEYAPLAATVEPKDKRLFVSIEEQKLTVYEANQPVREMKVSTGLPNQFLDPGDIPTETPTGSFHISVKWPLRHMGDGYLTRDPDAYELPGVPWTMFFHQSGYALHGAYWHDNFGTRMSHGCINLKPADALWLFRWTQPDYELGPWYVKGRGTLINIE